jgi:hypothetical protein
MNVPLNLGSEWTDKTDDDDDDDVIFLVSVFFYVIIETTAARDWIGLVCNLFFL